MYSTKNVSIRRMSKILRCSGDLLRYYFKLYNIPKKSLKDSRKARIFLSKKHKQNISRALKGRPSPLKGTHFSEERKKEYSKKFSGKNNPFYNKKHTKATKKQMSTNHANFKGNNNPYRKAGKEVWVKCGLKSRGIKRSKSVREQMAINSAKANLEYIRNKSHISGWFLLKRLNKKYFFRSSYELLFLNKMKEDLSIFNIIYEPKLKIPYFFGGITRYYRPDYLINNKFLIEIKPYLLCKTEQNRTKIFAAINFCKKNNYIFRLYTEKYFKNFYGVDSGYLLKKEAIELIKNNKDIKLVKKVFK
jgi:hypothetical protein